MGIFTRDNEELLGYDEDAFFYFAATMLLAFLTPATYYLVKGFMNPRPPEEFDWEARGPMTPEGASVRRCTASAMEAKRRVAKEGAATFRQRLGGIPGMAQWMALLFLWMCLVMVILRLQDTPEKLRSFDPYQILGISSSAEMREIKKAYRTKSLQHHPDKDRDNPMAHVQFQQVSKAYAALTDESARRNYEKYGNPDGPAQMKVGIALHPALLMDKESQRTTMCIFFFILFLVPFSVVCCCLRGAKVSAGGVCMETQRIYHAVVDAEVTVKDVAGLISASIEARRTGSADIKMLARAMADRAPPVMEPGVLVEITCGEFKLRRGVLQRKVSDLVWAVKVWPIVVMGQDTDNLPETELPAKHLVCCEPTIECCFSDSLIRRKAALLWAHLWRMHGHMTDEVKDEVAALLRHADRLGRCMVAIAAQGQGDRSRFFHTMANVMRFRQCLTQALDIDASPLLQIPHVKQVPKKGAPTLMEVVAEGSAHAFIKSLNLNAAQLLDVDSFCRHVPRIELQCVCEVADEENIAEGDMATLTVRLIRTNLEEGEAAGPVHAPLCPFPKFEEWWLVIYDERSRRLVTADAVLGNGRTEKCDIRFMVPRHGEFRWTVHAICDSYLGIDVKYPLIFSALKKSEINHEIFVHPQDMHIRSLFEELMEGLNPPEEDSESEDEEPPSKAVEAKAAEPPKSKACCGEEHIDSDDDSDPGENGEPEGMFYRVVHTTGAYVYREPVEDVQMRVGSVPAGMVIRGFVEEGRPEGWAEMAYGGGAWLRIDGSTEADEEAAKQGKSGAGPAAECLGPLCDQNLHSVVQTMTPIYLVKRWMRRSAKAEDLGVQDMLQVREMDDIRARMLIEELIRKRVGDETYEALINQVQELKDAKTKRLTKALGYFSSQNGIVWHVTPAGAVRGLHQDGSRIRDRVEVSADNQRLSIGPFSLDESRTCSCIHWLRKEDPTKGWVWSRDLSLSTRVRLGSAF
mmetsp:Transcript_81797/g.210697  ORF Transcript_81797/g.210697 Transcript_81797/m.210697 type:complete len:972 (-) Transcript_81797:148-3063(-)